VSVEYELNSDNLGEDVLNWLEELVGTPVAYMEVNSELIPITVNDQSVTTSDVNNLSNLKLKVRLANNIRNQRL